MKAKTSIKKALSMIVALMMLLSMIPMGMVSVSAEEPTFNLNDYETAAEYTIMNTADWIMIAESGKDFEGITVKLGADIDAAAFTTPLRPQSVDGNADHILAKKPNGAKPTNSLRVVHLAATFPTLFANFKGTFDGQGHTIKNAKVEEALIAAVALDGAEISNVNIVNVQVSDLLDYLKFGIVVGEAKGSLTIENVHLTDCMADGWESGTNWNFAVVGGFVGMADAAEGVTDAFLEITNCSATRVTVTNSVARSEFAGWHYGVGVIVAAVKPNFDVEIGDILIKDCNVPCYEVSAGGVVGMLHVGEEKIAEISNIEIDGLDVYDNRPTSSDRRTAVGPVVGIISPCEKAYVDIDKVNITNTECRSDSGSVGGAIGGIMRTSISASCQYTDVSETGAADIEINISNIYTDAKVESYDTANSGDGYPSQPLRRGAGGLIGQFGAADSTDDAGQGHFMRADVNIYNCHLATTVIGGAYNTAIPSGLYNHGAGGVFGQIVANTAIINLTDTLIDVKFPVNSLIADPDLFPDLKSSDPALKAAAEAAYAEAQVNSVGLIAYGARTNVKTMPGYGAGDNVPAEFKPGADGYYEAYLNANNVTTTLFGDYYLFALTKYYGGFTYNGTEFGGGNGTGNNAAYIDDGIVHVEPSVAKSMVVRDTDGFVDKVAGAITAPANVQISAVNDGKVDIRFIALCYTDSVQEAVAEVNASKDRTVVKCFKFENIEVFDKLDAVANLGEYTAKDYGAKKFMAVTIQNVPVSDVDSFSWVFSYKTEGGIVVRGNEISGSLAADGTFTIVE